MHWPVGVYPVIRRRQANAVCWAIEYDIKPTLPQLLVFVGIIIIIIISWNR